MVAAVVVYAEIYSCESHFYVRALVIVKIVSSLASLWKSEWDDIDTQVRLSTYRKDDWKTMFRKIVRFVYILFNKFLSKFT